MLPLPPLLTLLTPTRARLITSSPCHSTCVTNIRKAVSPVSIVLPDGSLARSSHTGELRLPALPPSARTCHLVPGFRGSLLSIGVLCASGLVTVFDDSAVRAHRRCHPAGDPRPIHSSLHDSSDRLRQPPISTSDRPVSTGTPGRHRIFYSDHQHRSQSGFLPRCSRIPTLGHAGARRTQGFCSHSRHYSCRRSLFSSLHTCYVQRSPLPHPLRRSIYPCER